jgi:hypothetical protein
MRMEVKKALQKHNHINYKNLLALKNKQTIFS